MPHVHLTRSKGCQCRKSDPGLEKWLCLISRYGIPYEESLILHRARLLLECLVWVRESSRKRQQSPHHLIPQRKSLMSERLKGPGQMMGRPELDQSMTSGVFLQLSRPALRAASSTKHAFPASPLGGAILQYNSTGYPHCTDGATEVQKRQWLGKFDVGACPCLPPPATDFLVLRGGKAPTDDMNCISTWELLVITGVAPQCSECLQLAFHFHFRYSIMHPHSQIYLLHPVYMSQTIYWMRQNDSKTHCQNHLLLLGFRGQLPKKQVYLVKNSVFLKFSSWYQVYCRFWAEYLWIQPETFTKYPPRKNTLGVTDMSKLT